jgi:SRSO17 transposase
LVLTWLWKDEKVVLPVAAQLYLPPEWTDDPKRLAKAGIPIQSNKVGNRWAAALELLLRIRAQLPNAPVLFDIHYGACLQLLDQLENRNIPYLARMPRSGESSLLPTELFPVPSQRRLGMTGWYGKGLHFDDWLRDLSETETLHPIEVRHPEGQLQYLFAKRTEL